MNYQIKRGEQTFGPYTLADLQKYVQSGNIALSDLTQSEGMSDWAPVSQVIGNIRVPVTSYGAAASPTMQWSAIAQPVTETVPLPPNLHWILLLSFYLLTYLINPLLFLVLVFAWMIVQATWARKLDNENSTLVIVLSFVATAISGMVAAVAGKLNYSDTLLSISGFLFLGALVCYIIGRFKIKTAMEAYYNTEENIGLTLNPLMTLVFGELYFQYHINRIAKIRRNTPISGIFSRGH